MANLICVRLNKGDAPSWGFRLQGGKDFGTPLVVQKVIGGSPAERAGLIAGDTVFKINNTDVYNLRHKDAQDVILRAGSAFDVAIQRGGSTWKPSVTPVGAVSSPRPAASVNHISPVTATSLSAARQESIGAIGTSHNVSAKPFHQQVNGGPKLVNKQYNSPLPLYSDQSIAETLSAQTEVLANGVLGVNFKKNEKHYDSANSEVFRMVQEADKEPRDYESVNRSDFYATHSHAIGGHSTAQRTTPTTDQYQSLNPEGTDLQQSELDQKSSAVNQQITKCSDCERVIVGVFVRIKDKNLHVECFKCSTCGSSLKNVGYYNLNNKLYCDVHAKLAVKNNPPAPNLQPVTVPPGGKIPSGTISAALSSHSLPSPSSLSPNINYSAAPYLPSTNYSSHRPFSSVAAPLSPSSHTPKLSPTSTPFTGRSSVKPSTPYREKSGVHSIVWPPVSSEPEVPTASPLYFPPPSQVQVRQKNLSDDIDQKSKNNSESEYIEQEEMSYIQKYTENRNLSFCSAEVCNITERRSAMECSEAISDTVDNQILVESIVQSRPKSPLPIVNPVKNVREKPIMSSGDVNVSFTISEADLKKGVYQSHNGSVSEVSKTTQVQENKTCLKDVQSHSLASMYEKKIKVENTVPHKWESSMVTALTVASDKPYSHISDKEDEQAFLEIPVKKPSTALGAALAIAPSEPFRTAQNLTLEPVPLPEETVPYFPPEHPVIPQTQDNDPDKKPAKTKIYGNPKVAEKDEFFKDLPSPPTERISMLAALTTAPDRCYSPFSAEGMSTTTATASKTSIIEEKSAKVVETDKKVEQVKKIQVATKTLDDYPMFKNSEKPMIKSYVSVPTTRLYNTTAAAETAYSMSTDSKQEEIKTTVAEHVSEESSKSEMTKNIQTSENIRNISGGLPPMIQVVRSTFETNTDKVQMEMSCQFLGDMPHQIVEKHTTTDFSEQKVANEKIKEKTQSTHQEHQSQHHQAVTKACNKEQKAIENIDCCRKSCGTMQTTASQIESKTINLEKEKQLCKMQNVQETAAKERVTIIHPDQTNLNVPKISFQPVSDDPRSNTTFSPRPGSLTPSMINKPAPVLPYYQSSLVATQCAAAETNVFDPRSPAISRSPSPYLGRPLSPFVTPSASVRPVSPAQGPPPNPLESKKSVYEIKQEGKLLDARSQVKSFIPQHQSKVGAITSRTMAMETSESFSNSYDQNLDRCVKENTKQMCEMGRSEGIKVRFTNDGNTQTQRKTHVSEEFEHTQKSKTVEVKKFSSSSQVSETQHTSKVADQAIGFHVTNPQPLKSPFLNATADTLSTNKTDSDACAQSKIPKKVLIPIQTEKPSTSSPSAATLSNKNVTKPGVSQPNAGTGGRQAGAIGVAPKRGRGILNLAATPGSRVPLCAQCNANIRGPFITALGKIWCPDHFICATPSCRRPLHDLGFVEERGQLYCEYCFEQYLAPPCSKCNAKIKGDCLKAIGRNFHPECFNCVYCGKLFGNSPFFLEDAQPYCETDWNELFTTKCFACGFPVEAGDRWVEALSNNYHSQCFNCTMCKKNLEGQSFFAKGGRPFCKNHAR